LHLCVGGTRPCVSQSDRAEDQHSGNERERDLDVRAKSRTGESCVLIPIHGIGPIV
jgi:hypothetical protein